jgi:carbonic anhydrase
MPHTQCKMASADEPTIHAEIERRWGVDTRSLEFRTTGDQVGSLREDLVRIRSYPLLPDTVAVGGAIYDVDTGLLTPVDLGGS